MDYKKNYDLWNNFKGLDKKLRKELDSLNEKEIEDAFYTNLSFGTGGLRGVMGVGTNRVNIYTIRKATLGFANYLVKHNLKDGIAISYDNRHDSKLYAKEAAMIFAAKGIPSYVFEALRPTPMLSFAVRYFKASGGIMITASHNPKEYNGYKVYDQTGAQVNPEVANIIIDEINTIENPFDIKTVDNNLISYIDQSFDDIYLKAIENIQINNENKVIKIVYSPLHGTGGPVIPKFLKSKGYDIYPYEPQMIVDPDFSNTKSSNPEESDAYIETIKYAKEIDADIIMITDPDADRLGIAVKHDNQYHLLSGNQTASIELYYLLSQRRKLDKLPINGHVYTTNVTTMLIDAIARSYEIDVITTLTGFKFIGEQAEKYIETNPYLFGCEESYGSLISDVVRDKDAVQAVYMLAEITNHLKLKDMSMIDYLNHIYKKYGAYYEYTKSIMLKGIEGSKKIDQIMAHFRETPPKVFDKHLIGYDDVLLSVRVEDGIKSKLKLPKSNVLRYIYEEHTWMVLRPSGTEPKIKIYYGTKKDTLKEAKEFLALLNEEVLKQIEEI
ncbi:phospho-sugar mutase [Mariniplasma anaerobium]|uniref:Phosphoglucomutase n=1 Tax=Mariniplasma anaerobium TaxID=2735436 RepID=A0A7U9TJT1_9MOLU|nr:phospho-sugar mutase [Mariniplasma anaerobium]BCR36037.1 phosphoglucomutase [Mariniplasma anaerobium]